MKATISTGYEPHFDLDVKYGHEGEKMVLNFLIGDHGTYEVKRDRLAHATGNVFVETHQLSRDGTRWVPSGINVTKAEWYVFCGPNLDGFIMVRTELLKTFLDTSEKGVQDKKDENTNAAVGRKVKVHLLTRGIMRGQDEK